MNYFELLMFRDEKRGVYGMKGLRSHRRHQYKLNEGIGNTHQFVKAVPLLFGGQGKCKEGTESTKAGEPGMTGTQKDVRWQ